MNAEIRWQWPGDTHRRCLGRNGFFESVGAVVTVPTYRPHQAEAMIEVISSRDEVSPSIRITFPATPAVLDQWATAFAALAKTLRSLEG